MKNILWTSLFWILVVLFFVGFLKRWDDGKTANFLNSYILETQIEKCEPEVLSWATTSGNDLNSEISENIETMQVKIDEMSNLMQTMMKRNFNEDISSVFYQEEQTKKSETMLKIEELEQELNKLKTEVNDEKVKEENNIE